MTDRTVPPPKPQRLRTAVAIALTRLADQLDAIEDDHADDEVSLQSMAESLAKIADVCVDAHATATKTHQRLIDFADDIGAKVGRIEEAVFDLTGRVGIIEEARKKANGHANGTTDAE